MCVRARAGSASCADGHAEPHELVLVEAPDQVAVEVALGGHRSRPSRSVGASASASTGRVRRRACRCRARCAPCGSPPSRRRVGPARLSSSVVRRSRGRAALAGEVGADPRPPRASRAAVDRSGSPMWMSMPHVSAAAADVRVGDLVGEVEPAIELEIADRRPSSSMMQAVVGPSGAASWRYSAATSAAVGDGVVGVPPLGTWGSARQRAIAASRRASSRSRRIVRSPSVVTTSTVHPAGSMAGSGACQRRAPTVEP